LNKDVKSNDSTKSNWVVHFLNLPPKEQVEFLFRYTLETEIRKEIERKVFGDSE
jgi:beta-lactamase class D